MSRTLKVIEPFLCRAVGRTVYLRLELAEGEAPDFKDCRSRRSLRLCPVGPRAGQRGRSDWERCPAAIRFTRAPSARPLEPNPVN